uniref:Zinc metalloproteinase n=1 Tax=Rhabditophanes sp. KR3021 TaxID=114890 RepID=A0AC35U7Q5_9BILA
MRTFILVAFVIVLLLCAVQSKKNKVKKKIARAVKIPADKKSEFEANSAGLKRLAKMQQELLGAKQTDEVFNYDNYDGKLMRSPFLFQGDVMLTDSQIEDTISEVTKQVTAKKVTVNKKGTRKAVRGKAKGRGRRSILSSMYYKWEMPIPYYIQSGNASNIDIALAGIQKETCITFKRSPTVLKTSGLNFYKGEGCWSFLGRVYPAKPQEVSLGTGCEHNGVIQHEVSHALGLEHEQSRPDRDSYISVDPKNVLAGMESQFTKSTVTNVRDFSLSYNFGSVMHYDTFAFSKNQNKTMTAKMDVYENTMGQYNALVFSDIKILNYHYCNDTCSIKIMGCQNGGYQNPKACDSCRCPSGFGGLLCDKVNRTSSNCGKLDLKATKNVQTLSKSGNSNCYWRITADPGMKIKVTIQSAKLTFWFPCWTGYGLEVKFRKDLAVSGAMFCGTTKNKSMTSESNVVVIHYPGGSTIFHFKLTYQQVPA